MAQSRSYSCDKMIMRRADWDMSHLTVHMVMARTDLIGSRFCFDSSHPQEALRDPGTEQPQQLVPREGGLKQRAPGIRKQNSWKMKKSLLEKGRRMNRNLSGRRMRAISPCSPLSGGRSIFCGAEE
jgi:hypothetical protein